MRRYNEMTDYELGYEAGRRMALKESTKNMEDILLNAIANSDLTLDKDKETGNYMAKGYHVNLYFEITSDIVEVTYEIKNKEGRKDAEYFGGLVDELNDAEDLLLDLQKKKIIDLEKP